MWAREWHGVTQLPRPSPDGNFCIRTQAHSHAHTSKYMLTAPQRCLKLEDMCYTIFSELYGKWSAKCKIHLREERFHCTYRVVLPVRSYCLTVLCPRLLLDHRHVSTLPHFTNARAQFWMPLQSGRMNSVSNDNRMWSSIMCTRTLTRTFHSIFTHKWIWMLASGPSAIRTTAQ